jgi:hypothetical protein
MGWPVAVTATWMALACQSDPSGDDEGHSGRGGMPTGGATGSTGGRSGSGNAIGSGGSKMDAGGSVSTGGASNTTGGGSGRGGASSGSGGDSGTGGTSSGSGGDSGTGGTNGTGGTGTAGSGGTAGTSSAGTGAGAGTGGAGGTSGSGGNGDFPNARTTGVPPGTTLKPWDGHEITDNEVVDGWDIPHNLNISACNVTIKRSHIHGNNKDDNRFGLRNSSGCHLTVQDTEIDHFSNGIGFGDCTALRVHIHDTGDDCSKLGNNTTIVDSYFHAGQPAPGAHQDCGQMQDGVVNLTIRHNRLEDCSNAALFITPDLGPSTDGPVIIDGNLLSGGNYTVFILDGSSGKYFVRNITLTNNRFVRNTSRYGALDINVPVTSSGNVWNDDGTPVE